MKRIDIALASLLFTTPLIHLLLAPYTKVEESFNLQATHDILVYGLPLFGRRSDDAAGRIAAAYDHFAFPGAVPRTFTGAVLLAGLSQPVVGLVGFQHAQLVVRAVLGVGNAACLLVFWGFLRRAFGVGVARWWTGMLVTQFHVMFYLSRTLPNMYAFALTTLASAFTLTTAPEPAASSHRKKAVACLTIAAAVFRSEVAILLLATAAHLLLTHQLTLRAIIPPFAASFIVSLAVTVPLDSYLWQRWLWPELWGFYYNAVQGQSASWGVSAWHYYATSALPRLLLNPLALPLILLAASHPVLSRRARHLLIPSAAFIAVYSLQPHKETRFIFYVVPPVTAAAALGADFVTIRRSKSILYRLSHLAVLGSLLFSLALSTSFLLLSSLNYPGGDALSELRSIIAHADTALPSIVNVHADVLTCITGLTLFTQNTAGLPLALPLAMPEETASETRNSALLIIDKTEKNITLGKPSFWEQFDFALLENPALALGTWETVGVVQGFNGIELLTPRDGDEAKDGVERTGEDNVLGLGAYIACIRRFVRKFTGGWWLGPRMSNRIRIVKNLKGL